MLHPTLAEEYLPEQREMTTKTGLLSASKSQASLMFKSGQSIDQTPAHTVFTRYKEFVKMPKLSMEVVSN